MPVADACMQIVSLTIRGLPATAEWGWRRFRAWLDEQGLAGVRGCDKDLTLDFGVVHFCTDKDRQ